MGHGADAKVGTTALPIILRWHPSGRPTEVAAYQYFADWTAPLSEHRDSGCACRSGGAHLQGDPRLSRRDADHLECTFGRVEGWSDPAPAHGAALHPGPHNKQTRGRVKPHRAAHQQHMWQMSNTIGQHINKS